MKENVKSIIHGVSALLIGYLIIMMIFQFSLAFQKNVATGYMHSNCELMGNSHGNKWYECDAN